MEDPWDGRVHARAREKLGEFAYPAKGATTVIGILRGVYFLGVEACGATGS